MQLCSERDRVIAEHRYLCRRAARRFLRPGLDRADLEQVAAIGLIKAADRYDAANSTPFEAYAWLLILGELMHHVRDGERLLRAPRRIRDLEKRWTRAERDLSFVLGREPTEADVAQYVNASLQQRRDLQEYRASRTVLSFETFDTEQCGGGDAFDGVLNRMVVDRGLSALSPLEQRIVRSIHLDGMSVVELARRLGYSRRHVTRLHRCAMQRLRNYC